MTDHDEARGRAEYEADVKATPLYPCGTPRKTWEQLPEIARWSWSRPPGYLERYGHTGPA